MGLIRPPLGQYLVPALANPNYWWRARAVLPVIFVEVLRVLALVDLPALNLKLPHVFGSAQANGRMRTEKSRAHLCGIDGNGDIRNCGGYHRAGRDA